MAGNRLRNLTTFAVTKIEPKICIIGSGPAGFYAAEYLQRRLKNGIYDIYERFPVPFGLVRYGVAPDHFNIKNAMNSFTRIASKENINFYGNITLGKDILLSDLRKAYHIVLLAYGADENRLLEIPGENITNVVPARRIVNWYNGHPFNENFKLDLSKVEDVLIIGQGNVAIDIARILLTSVDKLKKTDITEYALEALSRSKVKNVSIIGRRGPIQVSFTIKELRELLKIENCSTIWREEDFVGVADALPNLKRPKNRIVELMLNNFKAQSKQSAKRTLNPRFFLSPLSITNKHNKLEIEFVKNKLHGTDLINLKAIPTEEKITIPADLVVTSIGYKSVQADKSIPFDFKKGVTQNINGKIDKGLYSSGWVSSGPTGVLLSTMNDSFRTSDLILKDIVNDKLIMEEKPGYTYIQELLKKKNVQVVSWKDWLKIDEYEKAQGKKLGKPQEKILDIETMLKVAA